MSATKTSGTIAAEMDTLKAAAVKAGNDLGREQAITKDLRQKLAAAERDRDAAAAHAKRCENRANEAIAMIERLEADAALVCGGSHEARLIATDEVIGFVTPARGRQAFEVTDAVCHGSAKLGEAKFYTGDDAAQGAEAIGRVAELENELAEVKKELSSTKGLRTKAENALEDANNAVSERDQAIEDLQTQVADLTKQVEELTPAAPQDDHEVVQNDDPDGK